MRESCPATGRVAHLREAPGAVRGKVARGDRARDSGGGGGLPGVACTEGRGVCKALGGGEAGLQPPLPPQPGEGEPGGDKGQGKPGHSGARDVPAEQPCLTRE